MSDERGLGRRPPSDDRHLRRWSLTADTLPTAPTPVVLGINWYSGFSRDHLVERDGATWLPPQSQWGSVRGGHAICVLPVGIKDNTAWWRYYDQGFRGSCTGLSSARLQTLQNRERYDGTLIYEHAQRIDEWDDTPPEEGSSVRAAMDVLRMYGPYRPNGTQDPADGIVANRWAGSIGEIAACLSPADNGATILNRGYLTLLQSWGVYYPHFVRLELEGARRLIFGEEGEATVVTDR